MELLELFTSPTCPYCPKARKIVEDIVRGSENLLLVERDVSDPQNAEIARSYGITGVPALVINRKYKIQGIPDPARLRRLLKIEYKYL
jgi:small redox-active disulfide protein 1